MSKTGMVYYDCGHAEVTKPGQVVAVKCPYQGCDGHPYQGGDGQYESSEAGESLAARYPKYYKDVSSLTAIDVYQTHALFDIQDPSGCIQHASKKLLLSGVRTGGKSKRDDIREARDTLNRWLELNPE